MTVVSRQDCGFCDDVLATVRRLQAETPFELDKVDVAEDAQLAARYGARIPVVLIDAAEVGSGRITEQDLRRAIKRARWRRPISRILSRLGWNPKRG